MTGLSNLPMISVGQNLSNTQACTIPSLVRFTKIRPTGDAAINILAISKHHHALPNGQIIRSDFKAIQRRANKNFSRTQSHHPGKLLTHGDAGRRNGRTTHAGKMVQEIRASLAEVSRQLSTPVTLNDLVPELIAAR